MEKINLISIVVPAYKQEKTIQKNIKQLQEILSKLPYLFEIIVVVDGFVDKTYQNAKKIRSKNVKIIGYEKNNGKGFAVRFGMLKAKGDIIGFVDAGMDINITGISLLLDSMIWNNADIIIGSKLHPESKVVYPLWRKILSWGYRNLASVLFDLNIHDTQVGMKFYKKKVVKEVFPRLLVKAFAFDIETLAVSNKLGYSNIHEGPVELNFNDDSSITSKSFWKIILLMLWDTFAVFYRLRILKYYTGNKWRKNKI